jgi:hypothetical protein
MSKTQDEVILKELQDRWPEGLTSIEAINRFGITRLAAVIYTLKQKGWTIESTMLTVPTSYGPTRIAEYTLVTKPRVVKP